MSKYLILVPPFFGHLFPTLAIGQELVNHGHSVTWVGLKPIDKALLPVGTNFIVPKEVEQFQTTIDEILAIQGHAVNIKDPDHCEWSFVSTWIPFCECIIEGLKSTILEYNPDVFIHDECMIAGPICARQLSIPYVTSISIAPGLFYSEMQTKGEVWLNKRMLELQKEYGINDNQLIFDSSQLNLVYSGRPFVYKGDRFPDHYKFLGPIVDQRPQPHSFDWGIIKKPNWPIIYVSLGTVLNEMSTKLISKVIDGLEYEKYNVIVSTNPSNSNCWPDNFYVQPYIPQTEILPQVDMLISTGGYNTVNEALLFGKPLLVVPYGNDQNGNSHAVANNDCGIRMRYKRMNGAKILEAVKDILETDKYKNAAMGMADRFEKGGAKEAVNLLEKFYAKNSAVTKKSRS